MSLFSKRKTQSIIDKDKDLFLKEVVHKSARPETVNFAVAHYNR